MKGLEIFSDNTDRSCLYFAEIFIDIHIIKDVISSKYSLKYSAPTSRRCHRIVTKVLVVVQGNHNWILYNNHGFISVVLTLKLQEPLLRPPTN